MVVGDVPPLASAFQPRPGLRDRIDRAWAGRTSLVLSGGGGVGKSQLAAAWAQQALAAGTELVVWVNAVDTAQVVTGYAAAAHRVRAEGAQGQDAESDARAFLQWLTTTSRSWLVVLDDVADTESIKRWWPPSSSNWDSRVLATSRRRDALMSGGGRAVIDVGTYAPDEAIAYLRHRFTDTDMSRLLDAQATDLLRELGHLPLALSHAAAYMINEDVPCASYLRLFVDQRSRLEAMLPPEADTEGYGRPVAAALLLALDAVRRRDPSGVAVPALCLTAHLDPVGHPLSLWADAAVTGYLSAHRSMPSGHADALEPAEVTAEQARSVLRLLHRYSLITFGSRDGARAVSMHALTARAARENAPAPVLAAAMNAAADALAAIWPEEDHTDRDLAAVLRANTDTLTLLAGDLLWQPDLHPVLYRAGMSLLGAGVYAAAVTHWQRLAVDAERLLGDEHPDTLAARGILTDSYRRAGRTAEAIALGERVAADAERLLGDDHPTTVRAYANLANSYAVAGRTAEAIALGERVLAEHERLWVQDDPATITARSNLAAYYSEAGRTAEAIALAERVVTDRERILGEDHPHTLASRSILAGSYSEAGRTAEAIALGERVVTDRERILGEDHPHTVESRANLAGYYHAAGRTGEAIDQAERAVTDAERILGDEYPDTLAARGNLAALHFEAGHVDEAIVLGERLVADAELILGTGHLHTRKFRGNLADAYRASGRLDYAIYVAQRNVTEAERLLGEDHPDTVMARSDLAACYWDAGRTAEALFLARRLVGQDNPDGLSALAGLVLFYEKTGQGEEAQTLRRIAADVGQVLGGARSDVIGVEEKVALLERAASDLGRLLGKDHALTLGIRGGVGFVLLEAGRPKEAIPLLERAAADTELLYGLQDAIEIFINLEIAYSMVDRWGEAITLLKRVVADADRILGPNHPGTQRARAALARCYGAAFRARLGRLRPWRRTHKPRE
ncbi:FxSxx-COOH system tetratricopeptide repeat protein [Streptomyces sp. NBC_01764]|uniref:FxSxx-COOH system tetratricopeptide repeat protein n=1 Tax=Streptomyces sp. NBC_01764 TaxID=2975935 RepID=UPI00224C831A|nr:FxSxx-COOH system tetratricopeptide repeat protein [Streptomyces sp. NBC_01764]MCX4404354.1 FxSxx-COOH system tetratricopeptide repeat protein [Streptomyces sp. NBC_01764]